MIANWPDTWESMRGVICRRVTVGNASVGNPAYAIHNGRGWAWPFVDDGTASTGGNYYEYDLPTRFVERAPSPRPGYRTAPQGRHRNGSPRAAVRAAIAARAPREAPEAPAIRRAGDSAGDRRHHQATVDRLSRKWSE